MTSSTDTSAHPDVIEIADLAEGVLPSLRAAQIRAHIGSCSDCAEVLASLQEISGLLGGIPEPEPMPAEVAQRIDAALAAEPWPVEAQADVPRETAALSQPTGFHADVPRGTSAPAGHPSAPTGPGRRTQRRRRLLLTATSCAAVLVLGGLTYQLASHSRSGGSGADSSAVKGSSRSDSGGASVEADVARLLGSAPGAKTGKRPDKSPFLTSKETGTVVTAPDGTVTAVPSCVLQATHRAEQPLAAEHEPFQGIDSYLVVLPDPADASKVDAVVVTASCTAATPGHVLFQNSYPRG